MVTVLHIITGLNDGGAEAVLYRLCSADKRDKHVVVSMMDEGKYGPLLTAAGVEVCCLHASRGKISPKSIWKMWRIIRARKPAVVQTWMYHANLIGGLVAFVSGCRRIIWSIRHVHLTREDSKLSTRMVDRIGALLSFWIPEQIIAISPQVSEAHIAKGYARKFTVIYNGCDTATFRPKVLTDSKLAEELGLRMDRPIVGCVARWTPEKDHATFLKAIAIAGRKCRFQAVLVGEGCVRDNDALSEIIQHTGTQDVVVLAGPRLDIPDVMSLLDVHVLPSMNEAFGNVLIEAMAAGTPCISTTAGDAVHILGDTGWIVEARDPAMMSESIIEALTEWTDREKWERRQRNARLRVIEKFAIEKMVSSYQRVWRNGGFANRLDEPC